LLVYIFSFKIISGIFILIIVFWVLFLLFWVRVVNQWEVGLKEFLWQYTETVNPGLVFIIPGLQTLKKIDVREQVINVPLIINKFKIIKLSIKA
jgi:regulator of protease activity HflC (stomatin/prohibitin superfamily)